MRLFLVLAALLLVAPPTSAQIYPPILTILDMPYAAPVEAMGGAGAFLPDADPYAFLQNPAQLATLGETPGVYIGGYSGVPNWLATLSDELSTYNAALGVGWTQTVLGRPGRLGVGARLTRFNLGSNLIVDEQGVPRGEVDAADTAFSMGIGAGLDSPVRVDAGVNLSYGRTTGYFGFGDPDSPIEASSESALAFDLGVTVTAPLVTLLDLASPDAALRPVLDLSAGYTQRNIGSRIRYDGQEATDVLPRTATLGWAAQLGLDRDGPSGRSLRLIELDAAIEADGALNRIVDGDFDPSNPQEATQINALFLGRMGPDDALLGRGENFGVVGRRGVRLTLGEAVWIARGQYDGNGYLDWRTDGFGVQLSGLLRMTGLLTGKSALDHLGASFDLRYATSYASSEETGFNNRFHTVSFVIGR